MAEDGIILNLGGLDGLNTLPAYPEKWHIQLWKLAFSAAFKGVCPFKKSDEFVDYHGANLLEKRVIYK